MADKSKLEARHEEAIRTIAVTLVDGRHGYTMEFAASPRAHCDEYDETERNLRTALSMNKLRLVRARSARLRELQDSKKEGGS